VQMEPFSDQICMAANIIYKNDVLASIFFKSVICLLFVTAGGKLAMAFGHAAVLNQPSPLLHLLSNRALLCLAAGIEIAVMLLVLST